MKKILFTLLLVLALFPSSVLAISSSVNRDTDHIEPLNKADYIKGVYFTATSTTGTSTFPKVNIATALKVGADYITDLTGTGLQRIGTALSVNTSAILALFSATSPVNLSSGVISINNDGITDTQLAFNTGQNLTSVSTPTFASSTYSNLPSVLLKTDSSGNLAKYTGTTCTNSFVRALSVLGVATCNAVVTGDITDGTIVEADLNLNNNTAGRVLQASSTAPGGWAWVSTSTLGITSGTATNFWAKIANRLYPTSTAAIVLVASTTLNPNANAVTTSTLQVTGDIFSSRGLIMQGSGAAIGGARIDSDNGAYLRMKGYNTTFPTDAEGITWNLGQGSNVIGITSDTGVGRLDFGVLSIDGSQFRSTIVGTASIPNYSFSGDPNSGLFKTVAGDANSVSVSTNAVNRFTVTSGGIGIATTSPRSQLHINNSLATTSSLLIASSSGTSLIVNNGLTGLGTSTPAKRLSVAGDIRLTGALFDGLNSAGTNGMIHLSTGSSQKWVATSSIGLIGSSSLNTSAKLRALLTDEVGSGFSVFSTAPTLSSTTITGIFKLTNQTASRGLFTDAQSRATTTAVSSYLSNSLTDETGSGALVFGSGNPTITLANGTGLPVSTGITGLGTGIATWLATPSSANLLAALTDETGGNRAVFSLSPAFAGTATFSNLTASGTLSAVAGILRAPYLAAPTISTNGDVGVDSTSNQFKYQSGGATQVLGNGNFYPAFTIYSTTTAFTGTTTWPLGPAFVAETWNAIKCFTDVGSVNVRINDGTNLMNNNKASTTVGVTALSTNNTFVASEKRYVQIGTPVSSPTRLACTVSKSITAD